MRNRIAGKSWAFAVVYGLTVIGCAQQRSNDAFVTPIRPGDPGKTPFWNAQAKQFIAPPAFDFPPVTGASVYRFAVACAEGQTRVFEAKEPSAALTPVW